MGNYSESLEKAFAEIDDFRQKTFFPGGKPQAKRLVDSYRYLLRKDDLPESIIFELQRAIGARILMGFDNERIKNTLDIRYSDVVDKDQQDPLLAYIRTSLTNPDVTLVAPEDEKEPQSESAADVDHPDAERSVPRSNDSDEEIREHYQFESLNEFLAYVPISKAKGVSVAWVKGSDYSENFEQGFALLDERRYLEAVPLYRKCLEVNPVAFRARLELITCYTMLGRYGMAREQINALAQYHMPSQILASFYRRYGYLLAEEGKNLASYACYQYSLNYESSDMARGEIKYLSAIMNEDLSKYKPEEIMAKAGIPILQSVPQANAPQE